MNEKKFANRFQEGTAGNRLTLLGKLKHDTVAAIVNDELVDLFTPVKDDELIEPVGQRDDRAVSLIRHSTAHVMADAVQRLFPDVLVAIGPSIETGFYYDFHKNGDGFTEEDLERIENRMKKIIDEKIDFEKREMSRDEAASFFGSIDEKYKLEILEGIDKGETITLYNHGQWTDLCAGPHVPHTGFLKNFKLLTAAGAYWRGDEKNVMLQRIYGTAFGDKKSLKKHLNMLEEAKKRDHRKLGKELELFSVDNEIGAGLILWHPAGSRVRAVIEDHWREQHVKNGYDIIYTPHIGRANLWETSGHLENYGESMYAPMEIENNPYYIKPMNCPFHIGVYRSRLRSYRELPLRWAELGTVYRNERSGQLHGLMRVRGFTQDDAHLFMRSEDLKDEISKLIRFTHSLLSDFGFNELQVVLSTRPEKYIGSLAIWEKAEKALADGLALENIEYETDEGEGTFYGPKIDVKIKDAIGRLWQCSTTQVDFNLPERFNLSFIGEDSKKQRPVMLHRTILGSMERFFGILTEHYAGAFPMWLAPTQVILCTINENCCELAIKVQKELIDNGIRVAANLKSEKLGAKIRDARLKRIPAIAVIGDEEVKMEGVSLRSRKDGNIGFLNLENFYNWIKKQIALKSTN